MDKDIENLFDKVSKEIKNRKIVSLSGSFSIYKKELVLVINDERHNISTFVPTGIWRLGVGENIYNLNNPEVSWKIRIELSKIANKYAKDFDPTFEGEIML